MRRGKIICLSAVLLSVITAAPFPAAAAGEVSFSPPNPVTERVIQKLQQEVKEGRHSFTVGYSSAMEHPIDSLCTLKEPKDWLQNAPEERLMAAPLMAVPSSFDWRTQSGTTPIKNQGSCGGCWAFGTVGPLESQVKLQCGVTTDLSEQYLISCNTDGWGCNGGWWAHDYHLSKPPENDTRTGAVREGSLPYQASDVACKGPYTHPYQITSWSFVAGQPRPTVQAIKQAIYTYGPIGSAIYVGPKFQAYSSGIFDADESGQINHAIVLVGWKDDLGTDNGYWILRNSWGTGWGENGYMRIRYGRNQVGYSANYIQFACNSIPTPPPPALPDLRGSFISLYASNPHRVNGTLRLRNLGEAKAGAFKVNLYASTDGNYKRKYVGQLAVSGLAIGAYTDVAINIYTSTLLYSGKYLIAVIDPDSQVKESSESNNTVVRFIP
ncbi:MAG: C1 family peptidase [Syntrophobacteraceae bacterium]